MRIVIVLAVFVALSAQAKVVHFYIYYDSQSRPVYDPYTVDSKLKIWQLKNRVFGDHGLDLKKYALVQETAEGDTLVDPNNALENYGQGPDEPVKFRIIPAKADLPKEEAKPEVEAEKPQEEAPATQEAEKPKEEEQT